MVEMEESFGALISQLPSDTEVPGLLEDITNKGLLRVLIPRNRMNPSNPHQLLIWTTLAALVLAVIAVAVSPATTIAVITDLRARGEMVETVLGVTILKDLVIILLFTVVSGLAVASIGGGSFDFALLGHVALEIGERLHVEAPGRRAAGADGHGDSEQHVQDRRRSTPTSRIVRYSRVRIIFTLICPRVTRYHSSTCLSWARGMSISNSRMAAASASA